MFVFGLPAVLAALVLILQARHGVPLFAEQPGGEVAGRLTTADGSPVGGAAVELSILSRGTVRQSAASPFKFQVKLCGYPSSFQKM